MFPLWLWLLCSFLDGMGSLYVCLYVKDSSLVLLCPESVLYGGRQLPFKSDISHPAISNLNISKFNLNISNFKISNLNISNFNFFVTHSEISKVDDLLPTSHFTLYYTIACDTLAAGP